METLEEPASETPIPRSSWMTLATTSAAVFMVSVEITIISLALPEIRKAFPDTPEPTLSWVINAYSIGVAALLLVSGWFADRYGRRRLFLGGLAVFAVGSVLAGAAVSAEMLIAARAFQSIGGAMQFPAGLALLLTAFPRERHQFAIGVWGAMGGLAAAIGPSLGAVLVDSFGWRAVFFINVPVACAALIVGPRYLTESTGIQTNKKIDAVSVPLASFGVAAAILGIVQGSSWGWTSVPTIGAFAVSVVMITAFVWRSKRHPAPLFDLRLFRSRSYTVGNLGAFLFCLAFFGVMVPLPTFIQTVWGWSVLETGFAMAPGPFLAFLISPQAGRLADRIGNTPVLIVGALCGASGLIWFRVFLTTEPSLGHLLAASMLIGVAAGTGFAQLTGATLRDTPPSQYAMAGAGRTTIFQLSVAVAIASAFTIIGRPSDPFSALAAHQRVWTLGAAAYLGLSLLFAVAYPTRRREQRLIQRHRGRNDSGHSVNQNG